MNNFRHLIIIIMTISALSCEKEEPVTFDAAPLLDLSVEVVDSLGRPVEGARIFTFKDSSLYGYYRFTTNPNADPAIPRVGVATAGAFMISDVMGKAQAKNVILSNFMAKKVKSGSFFVIDRPLFIRAEYNPTLSPLSAITNDGTQYKIEFDESIDHKPNTVLKREIKIELK